jgi:hypothetical protein
MFSDNIYIFMYEKEQLGLCQDLHNDNTIVIIPQNNHVR